MKSTARSFFLAAGLLILPSLQLHAAIDSLLILDAKCYSQKKLSSTPDRVDAQINTARIDTKQLLKLVARDAGIKYENGSRLKVVAGAICISDANGKVLGNVSQYFQLVTDTRSGLTSGTRYLVTGEENTKNYQSMNFTINLPTLKGKVTGLLTENIRISSANKLGVQEARNTSDANVSGKGTINQSPALFEGTFQLRGLEAILNR